MAIDNTMRNKPRTRAAVSGFGAAARSTCPGAYESPSVAGSAVAIIGNNPNSRWGHGRSMSPYAQGWESAMNTFIGIDVAKEFFDLYDLAEDGHQHFEHTEAGISACLRYLRPRCPALVVMESTGGYETALAVALSEAGLPVAVVNPKRIRDFARATGQLAKTDQIDARVIGPVEKVLCTSLRAEMTHRQVGHRSAAISKSLPQCKLRSPRLDHEARSRLAMTGPWVFQHSRSRGMQPPCSLRLRGCGMRRREPSKPWWPAGTNWSR